MAKKLYVGNLSWDTTDRGLQQAFERFGPLTEVKIVTDRDTGRSRGFGFVTFSNDADAQSAQAEMDGTQLDGRAIRVNEAIDRDRGDRRGGDRRHGRGW